MPTKRAAFLFLFSLLLLIGAWLSKLLWLYFSFSACLGLIIFSYILSRLLIVNLEIKRYVPYRAYEDELINVTITLRNRIPLLDQSIEIQDVFAAGSPNRRKKVIYLNGLSRGKPQFSYQEKCYQRGRYNIGPFLIRVFEPLGLFCIINKKPIYSTLIVYPRIFHVQKLPFILGHLAPRFGEQTTRISGNYEEFYGIREYQREDGWRRIHWASTARLAELMVKHFEQSSQWRSVFVLDAHAKSNIGYGRDTTFEYAIKIIASSMKYLVSKNASFGLIASTKDPLRVGINKGKNHFYKILDELAVIKADGAMQLHQLIAYYQWMIPPSSSLIMATSNFSQALINFLRYLKIKKNIGIISVVLNADSFLLDNKQRRITEKYNVIKKAFYGISSELYLINCNDDLRVHFLR